MRRLPVRTIIEDHAIGPLHMVAEGGVLLALEFGAMDTRLLPMLRARFGTDVRLETSGGMERIADALGAYFAGDLAALDTIDVDSGGTDFQRQAWSALRAIPPGETRTYGQMAVEVGRPRAARAIGAANALNPISIVVPCHRLVGSDGALTGYGGGMARKRWLIDHERHWAANQDGREAARR